MNSAYPPPPRLSKTRGDQPSLRTRSNRVLSNRKSSPCSATPPILHQPWGDDTAVQRGDFGGPTHPSSHLFWTRTEKSASIFGTMRTGPIRTERAPGTQPVINVTTDFTKNWRPTRRRGGWCFSRKCSSKRRHHHERCPATNCSVRRMRQSLTNSRIEGGA